MMSAERSTLTRSAILYFFVLVGIPGVSRSATLEDSAKELAQKIAAALPNRENVLYEIRNLSSLQTEDASLVEQTLKAELQDRGVHISSTGAVITLLVTLSENLEDYVWTTEIHQGDSSRVVLVVIKRSQENRGFSNAIPVTIRSEKFWEGHEHILDAATVNSSDGGRLLLLLTVDAVLITNKGTEGFPIFSFPPVQTVLRNPAGILTQEGDLLVTATTPQQICIISLVPDGLSQCRPAEGPPTGRVFTTLQLVPPGPPHPEWGSQIQEIQNPCGSGAQFLVTGPGDYTQTDFIQLFGTDLTHDRPAGKPLSNPLTFAGPVMDLHAEGTGARAVVRNLETGSYEAHRISIECGR